MRFFPSLFKRASQRSARADDGESAHTLHERIGALRVLPALFRLIWAASPTYTAASIVLRLVRGFLPLGLLYISKLIIDEVVRLTRIEPPRNLSTLWTLLAIEFGLVLLSDLSGRLSALLDGLLGELFLNRTSLQIMAHAGRLDLEHFENPTFYDKLDRARNRTFDRIMLVSQTLGQFQDLLTIGFLMAGLIAFSPWLIVILVVAVLPGFLVEAYFNNLNYALAFRWTPERRELDYLRWLSASVETAKEVKLFNLSDFLKERYHHLSSLVYEANRSLATRRTSWGAVFQVIANAGYYAAFIVILLRTVAGRQSIGDLAFLSGSFNRLRGLLQGVLLGFASMAERALYTKDLFDFLEMEARVQSPVQPRRFPRPIKQGFTLENVGFKYPGMERWVLRNFSFTLHVGEKLALVGENGAGKTTLVKLLSRLYDPTEGRILLDGYDLREYDLNDLQREIGIIFQDYVRYQMTASENIAVGRIEERTDRTRIKRAAQRSLADAVIEKLPTQYDQIIGRQFAGGVDLSGGEWQKVALARAYMRDAQLLILDEPTSALDAEAEHEIFQRFAELTEGRMAILISHRFSTVRMADRILVLKDGRCLDVGTHTELLERNGLYARLFRLQAEGYS